MSQSVVVSGKQLKMFARLSEFKIQKQFTWILDEKMKNKVLVKFQRVGEIRLVVSLPPQGWLQTN